MRVDFYILSSDNLVQRDHFACQIIEKAFLSHHKLFVATQSVDHAKQLDELLWVFRPDSFVPHAQVGTTPAPIIIGTLADARPGYDVLVNLSEQQPQVDADVQRLIEIVPKVPEQQQSARERFRQYRELGFILHTHNIS
ncbi:MAG: DNA polymerase III subunit chi [Pseudomonadota bacterium]|nr:DNA polymerase III subunit chi [Pseudomonadota bacterium]